jgi:hypothetical protein
VWHGHCYCVASSLAAVVVVKRYVHVYHAPSHTLVYFIYCLVRVIEAYYISNHF